MLKCIKNFFTEEDGMGVIEIVIIIGVLVALALLFQDRIKEFAKNLMDTMFGEDGDGGPPKPNFNDDDIT